MLVNPFQLSNMMPDYSRMIGIPLGITGTALSDGYISIVGRGAAGSEKQLTEAVGLRINDVPVFTWGGSTKTQRIQTVQCFLLQKVKNIKQVHRRLVQ